MAQIRLVNVCKRWGSYVGVDNFTLEIADAEFLVLLGPSGCGKTTTMRMIAGLEEPSEGEIWIGDRMVNGLEPKDRDISMVFQSYGLYPNLTVYENIRFPLRVRNVPKAEIEDRVAKVLKMVELPQMGNRRPGQLSGGQKQRVCIARALAAKPDLIILDEPTSALDPLVAEEILTLLRKLQRELGLSYILITHDLDVVHRIAHRTAVMLQGEFVAFDATDKIFENPEHPYTQQLITAVPEMRVDWLDEVLAKRQQAAPAL